MKTFSFFAFAVAVLVGSFAVAAPRDAGSKVRGDANDSFGDAVRQVRTYNYVRTAPVAQPTAAPVAAPAVAARPAAPAPNTTAATTAPTGTRTMSVEPQASAPAANYRTYAPRRAVNNQWNAGRKIIGSYEY